MAEVSYGNINQGTLAATTLTAVYTAGTTNANRTRGARNVEVVLVERGGADTTYRVSHAKAGAADATSQYFAYDRPLYANGTARVWIGNVAHTDVLRAYTAGSNVTYQVIGEELP